MRRSSTTEHQWLKMVVGVRTDSRLSDAELLDRFRLGLKRQPPRTPSRALLLRHGPMVLSICSRILGDPHDAEDAFQATFCDPGRPGRSPSGRRGRSRAGCMASPSGSRPGSGTGRGGGGLRNEDSSRWRTEGIYFEATRGEEDALDLEALHQEAAEAPAQVPGGDRPLLSAGDDPGGRRRPASLPEQHGRRPIDAGPRAIEGEAEPPRDLAAGWRRARTAPALVCPATGPGCPGRLHDACGDGQRPGSLVEGRPHRGGDPGGNGRGQAGKHRLRRPGRDARRGLVRRRPGRHGVAKSSGRSLTSFAL